MTQAFPGAIDGGWSEYAVEPLQFKVLRFVNSPTPGASTFVTLGASESPYAALVEDTHTAPSV